MSRPTRSTRRTSGSTTQQLSVLGGGREQPEQKDFPVYVDSGSENPRGVHAIRVLDGKQGLTLNSLIQHAGGSESRAMSIDKVFTGGARRREQGRDD